MISKPVRSKAIAADKMRTCDNACFIAAVYHISVKIVLNLIRFLI